MIFPYHKYSHGESDDFPIFSMFFSMFFPYDSHIPAGISGNLRCVTRPGHQWPCRFEARGSSATAPVPWQQENRLRAKKSVFYYRFIVQCIYM